jgi:hypothetical protein
MVGIGVVVVNDDIPVAITGRMIRMMRMMRMIR